MEIQTAKNRTTDFVNELMDVWEASVRATHHFLADSDIESLQPIVRQGLATIFELVYFVNEEERVMGFMGIENEKIEMLFIHPLHRGQGMGKKLVSHAINTSNISCVDVNEQNVQGVGFYKHMGFKIISRSPMDENANPFPILHMSI